MLSVHCLLFDIAWRSVTFEGAVTHRHVNDDYCLACRRCFESAPFNTMVLVGK